MTDPRLIEERLAYQARPIYSSSTPEARQRAAVVLDTLIPRIPGHMADILIDAYYSDDGQRAVGTRWGITQSAVSYRLRVAGGACRLVALHPDWPHPDEVQALAEAMGESSEVADVVEGYLRMWRTTQLQYADGSPIPQATAYDRLRVFESRRGATPLGRAVKAVRGWLRPLPPAREARRRAGLPLWRQVVGEVGLEESL